MKITRNFRQIQLILARAAADQRGATMVEYGIFVFGLGAVLLATAFLMGDEIADVFNNLNGFLEMRNEAFSSGGSGGGSGGLEGSATG